MVYMYMLVKVVGCTQHFQGFPSNSCLCTAKPLLVVNIEVPSQDYVGAKAANTIKGTI